jgi:hypothetical protein
VAVLSYDLTLFRVPDGTEPSLAYQQIADQQEIDSANLDAWMKTPVLDRRRAEMERVAGALESWRPALERFQPPSPLPWIELNDEALQLQFEIYEAMVSITMPYFRDRAEEIMKCVTDSFEVLKSAAGYVAYDPQLGRIVTATDLSEMVARYRKMDDALPEILAQSRESLSGKKKPWWKLW